MKRLLVSLGIAGILLLAIGYAFGQNSVTAQSGTTQLFMPLIAKAPTPTPGSGPLYQLPTTAGRSSGGTSYQDSVPYDVHVSELWISSESLIEGMQFWYLYPDGMLYTSGPHGTWGGSLTRIIFDADEYIMALKGKSGLYMDSLSIVTNKRTFGTYGGPGGDTSFSMSAQIGAEIAGLFGRSGGLLDYTGALARQRSSTPFPTPVPPLRPVTRLGATPGWGEGGLHYQDTVPDDGRVAEVWVSADNMVQWVQFWYLRSNGTLYSPGRRGFQNKGNLYKLVLDADEYITAFHIMWGEFTDSFGVETNKRTFGPFGGTGGGPLDLWAPAGYEIAGLYGAYSLGINSIGALARTR